MRLTSLRQCFIGLFAALALTACQPATPPVETPPATFVHEVSDLPVDPAVLYGQLPNGMRYAVMQNDTPAETVAVRLTFNVGSLAESEDQRGLAHFIEHMAFNGSTNVPEGEMIPLLERYGLQFGPDTNAFTGFETVGYQLDLPENNEEIIATAMMLMRETASELTLDIDAIDAERGVIASEARFRNVPVRRWNNALGRFLLPDTLVPERDPIGLPEVIETAQREAFVDYYENFYIPQRAMMVVVGDVDPAVIESDIRETFGDWQGPEEPRPDPELGEINTDRPRSVGYFYDPEVLTIFTVDAMRPYEPAVDTVETRFENNLSRIGNAILSRRFETIVSSGTSPILQAQATSSSEYDLAELARVLAIVAPDRWEEGVALVEQELRRALDYGFTQAELDEQIANQRTSLRTAVEQAGTRDNTALANGIWSAWRQDIVFTTPASTLERFEAGASRITVDAVNAAFREQWQASEPLLFLASSTELTDAESAILNAWKASETVAVEAPLQADLSEFAYGDFGPAGEVASREYIEDLKLHRVEFENGVRLSFRANSLEAGEVAIRVDFGAGSLEPRALPTVDVVTSSAFTAGGLGAHSSDELSRVLAGRAVGLNFSVGESGFTLFGGTRPSDFDVQMDLLAAYISDPGWREDGLAQYKAIAPELRRNFASTPTGVLQVEAARLLRRGDARYGFPSEEELAAIGVAEMQAFLTPVLEQAPIEITIVGDIGIDQVIEVVAQSFGALPPRAESWPTYDEARNVRFPEPVAEPVELFHNGGTDQAMANVYWPMFDDSEPRRSRVLTLMRSVLDLKLTERLRERDGFTYSAFNNDLTSSAHPDYGYLWVGVDVQPENLEATYAAIDELAAAMASGDISEDELQRARQPLLEQIEEAQQRNAGWLSWVARSWEMPERLDRIRSIEADYNDISRDELVAMAEAYLVRENSWRVSILPNEDR